MFLLALSVCVYMRRLVTAEVMFFVVYRQDRSYAAAFIRCGGLFTMTGVSMSQARSPGVRSCLSSLTNACATFNGF